MFELHARSRADSLGSMSPSLLLVEEQVQVPAEGTRGQRQWGYKFRPSRGGSKKLNKQSAMRGNQSDDFSEGSQCAGAQMTVQRKAGRRWFGAEEPTLCKKVLSNVAPQCLLPSSSTSKSGMAREID